MTEVKTYYYTEGNTVRQVAQPLPDRHTREREIREERERRKRQERRKMQRMMRKKRIYSMYVAMVAATVVGLFVGYINLTNSITTHMDNISALEQNISDLKASNSATESRIASQTNLGEIKAVAVNEMGMVYANADQIVYYDMESSDYMNQYHNIP
ncbi:MAG: hypothetical protein EGR77_02450 [Pseudobutyrivibrio sp.]|nr:hypothetical protein [Pseudobutyrivibrio sp.]